MEQFVEEGNLKQQFELALRKEKIFLRQKSKVHWLKHEDKNNRFFINSYKGRWNQNKIVVLEDHNGFTHTTHQHDIALPSLSEDQSNSLIASISKEDVAECKRFAKNKCADLNGFNSKFFLKAWSIVGKDVFELLTHSSVIYSFPDVLIPLSLH